MANTYTQIYIHTVFAVSGRQSLIAKEHKVEIYKYMAGVIENNKQKVMAINGMPDHVHLLIGLGPDVALSNLVRDVKAGSSKLINDKRWVRGHFTWQGDSERFRTRALRCQRLPDTSRTRSGIMPSVRFEKSMRRS